VVIYLKAKGRRIIRTIVTVYLILSCICFDEVKTDSLVYPYDATNKQVQSFTEGCSGIKEDVCTVEMSGIAHEILLCRQSVTQNSEQHRKPELLFGASVTMAEIQLPLKSYLSFNASNFKVNEASTEIIRFIHNKDGKKQI
jgi:hypothetical protein